MMTAPDPQETWQPLPPRIPRCAVCYVRMPTAAHVFLHAQVHAERGAWLQAGSLRQLDLALYDRVVRLMQAYHDSHHPGKETPDVPLHV